MTTNSSPVPPSQHSGHGAGVDAEHRTGWRMHVVRVVAGLVVVALAIGLGFLVGRAARPDAVAGGPAPGDRGAVTEWTCSMHPQIRLPKFGQCPICFMDLVPATSADAEASATGLTLSPRARELARVETVPVARRVLVNDIRMVGKVAVDETRIRYVASYIPGRLDRLYVDYTGILVHKGDHLAEIYSPDLLVAQREYVLALEQAEKSGQEASGPAATHGSRDRSLLESARRKLELWGVPPDQVAKLEETRQPFVQMRVDAPSEGWVLERQGYEGMYVDTGTRLFTLADLRQVWVLLDAYELDLGLLRLAQHVAFETEAYPGRVFEGTIAYLDPVLRPDTRTVKVRVNVPNPDLSLRPEMFVRARVSVRVGENGQVVDDALAGKWICYMHPEIIKDTQGTCDICGMNLVRAESLNYIATGGAARGALAIPETAVLWTGDRGIVYVENAREDRWGY